MQRPCHAAFSTLSEKRSAFSAPCYHTDDVDSISGHLFSFAVDWMDLASMSAEKEKQEGIQGQWQRESLAEEYMEQVKCCKDTDCTRRMM